MNDNRPSNLNLLTIKWPLPAYTSILHRVSGVVIFLGLGGLLYMLQLSLASEQGFEEAQSLMSGALVKFAVWAMLSALLYHLIAGVKHLLMDLGVGETLEGGRTGAMATLVCGTVAIIAAGVWIW